MKLLMKKPAGGLWIALIGLCSLTGCFAPDVPAVPPAPVAIGTVSCPAPEAPDLPALSVALFLDAPDNTGILLERDDLVRRYIKGLRDAIRCYQSQENRDDFGD